MSAETPPLEAPAAPRIQCWLDSNLDQTAPQPVNPETGELWQEKYDELLELSRMFREEANTPEKIFEMRRRWKEATKDLLFRDAPHFVLHEVFATDTDQEGKPILQEGCLRAIGCHPATFAAQPPEWQAKYEPVDLDAIRARKAAQPPSEDSK